MGRVRWVFPSSMLTESLTDRHVVGREQSCDTVLHGTEISRRHAELWVNGPVLAVRDLDSRNGVFVNGVRCQDTAVTFGDVVRCGEWIGVVVGEGDALGFKEIAPGWYGGSALRAAIEPARRVGANLPIIVQGETGTGKEGMAQAIHGWSDRHGRFVAVNCAALPAHLAEAELFGYRKGAFTGADKASPGLFRAAQGGTIFLDEILDLPATVQPKLLRVLEQREVLALGETVPVAIDVRIVAATQESIARAVTDGRFRADLYGRLDGLTIGLPPLRARREDIAPLFTHFLRQETGGRPPDLEAKLVEALCLYRWPLNVRELLLLARRLMGVHGHEEILKRSHLPERILGHAPTGENPGDLDMEDQQPVRRKTDDETQFKALVESLHRHGGRVVKAAAAIGISRARAYRLISAHPDFSLDRVGK